LFFSKQVFCNIYFKLQSHLQTHALIREATVLLSWVVEVPAKIIYSGWIVIKNATFVRAQVRLEQLDNIVVGMEHVKRLVLH
jgi:hypothetical protein